MNDNKYIDISGQRFGKLVAISPTDKKCGSCRVWICKCDCGNTCEVSINSLRTNHTKSCGCLKRTIKNDVPRDLTGLKIGQLTVLKLNDNSKNILQLKNKKWDCICTCGKTKTISDTLLRYKEIISCGCFASNEIKKRNSKRLKKYNIYNLTGEYGIGYTSNTNKEFYFDIEDYDKIKNYCWYEFDNKKGYKSVKSVYRDQNTNHPTNHSVSLHRIILNNISKNIDHINRNPLDNRKSNLRPATKQENAMNHSLRKTNKSGVSGVSYNENQCKWVSQIDFNNKRMRLGYYIDFKDAVIARLKAEVKYFGEFAPQKHLYKEYGIEEIN